MGAFKNYREQSRTGNWGSEDGMTIDQINCGSMLRIADSLENIAKDRVSLEAERDRYKKWYHEEVERRQEVERSNQALRGVVTRFKRKLHHGEEPSQETNL